MTRPRAPRPRKPKVVEAWAVVHDGKMHGDSIFWLKSDAVEEVKYLWDGDANVIRVRITPVHARSKR